MKNFLRLAVPFIFCFLLTGCALLSPGNKEFFQTEVPVYPTKSTTLQEATKEGLQYVKYNITKAYDNALIENCSSNVVTPIHNAKTVIGPIAENIGHPATPLSEKKLESSNTADTLTYTLNKEMAKYEAKLDRLETKLDKVAGKDIEGTGLIQMSYWSFIAIIFGFLFVLYIILQIVSIFNPQVAVGTRIAGAGASLVSKGFSQVITGGEAFKNSVLDYFKDEETRTAIKKLFRQSQESAQDHDVKQLVKDLTAKG